MSRLCVSDGKSHLHRSLWSTEDTVKRRTEPDTLAVVEHPHSIEEAVLRRLREQPDLRFSSLVIRRIKDGVCVEGVLETDDTCPDLCSLAREVAGVEQVLNRLIIRKPDALEVTACKN